MGVTSIEFSIEGQKTLVPEEWQNISLFFSWGQFSNQPVIGSQKTFTFYNDSAKIIYDKYKAGYILRGIDISLIARQFIDGKEYVINLFQDFVINLTKGIKIKEADFNGDSPLSVTVTIEKKTGITSIIDSLGGINFTMLDELGHVNNSNYTTVKTAVQPLYNLSDIALALVSIYLLIVQIRNLIQETIDFVSKSVSDLTGLDAVKTAAKIIYIAVVVTARAITATLLIGALVTLIVDLISLLVPPILKNKAMTWRNGLEVIFNYLGYKFESTLKELDIEVILPSKPYTNSTNIIKDAFPNFAVSKKGYPHPADFGHNAQEYIELAQKRFNAKFDVIGDTIVMKWSGDQSLFKQSSFKPHLDINRESLEPNISDITYMKSFKFLTDQNDDYTTENYKGTVYYVINESKHLPFLNKKEINFNLALGSSKTKLSLIEKNMKAFAELGDILVRTFGGNSNMADKIKNNRTNVLKVSSNTYQVAKLVPIINGQMPANHRDITSAKAIENTYYYNESIKRGTGQKMYVNDWKNPFNLKNSEEITTAGKFISARGENVTIKELEYSTSEDNIEGVLEIDFKYIAESDYEELLIETPDL